ARRLDTHPSISARAATASARPTPLAIRLARPGRRLALSGQRHRHDREQGDEITSHVFHGRTSCPARGEDRRATLTSSFPWSRGSAALHGTVVASPSIGPAQVCRSCPGPCPGSWNLAAGGLPTEASWRLVVARDARILEAGRV